MEFLPRASWRACVHSLLVLAGLVTAQALSAQTGQPPAAPQNVRVYAGTTETTPPAVGLTAPAAGAVSGTVTVSASASDASGVAGVQFLLDGGALGNEDVTPPYSISWDTTATTSGAHTLSARGRDVYGNVATSTAITVNVSNVSSPTCSVSSARCVGSGQEYTTIQAAVTAAQAGDTVWVFDGTYQGFQVTRSGTASSPIVIRTVGTGAIISTASSTSDGVFLSNVSYVTVQGFVIQNMPQRCVSARNGSPTSPMKGLTIVGNSCSNAGREGFYLSQVSASLVEGNTITNTGLDGADRGHGIYLANAGSDNTTLRGNRISGMNAPDSAGIHMNGDLSIGGDGLISGVTIEGNVIFNGDQNGISMDGVQDSTIQNNLIYAIARNAVRGFDEDAAAGPKNLHIVNNTLIGGSGWAVKLSEDLGGHVVFNNILLSSSSGALCIAATGTTSDYNAVIDRLSTNNEGSIVTLAAWRAATGNDAHSLVASSTALFVAPASGDYHLKSGVSAIDAGAAIVGSVPAPATDAAGVSRPGGTAFDIGAYEY
jgi:parallel beta-helix repeat protein